MIKWLTLVAVLIALPAWANGEGCQPLPKCQPFDQWVKMLRDCYDEHLYEQGFYQRMTMSIFLDPDDESWSVILSGPTTSCLASSGMGWRVIERSSGERL